MRMADTISRSETMTGEQIKISVNSVFISRQETSWPDTRCWEKAYKEGKARSLGISNFQGEKLERLLSESEIKPHVIQMEVHPYFTQKEQRADHSPLAYADGVHHDPGIEKSGSHPG